MSLPPEERDRPANEQFCNACGQHHAPGDCDLDPREAQHRRDERMLQQIAVTVAKYRENHATDLEIKAISRTTQTAIKDIAASWDRTMRAFEQAAGAIEQAANAWERKASD
jgi:hypothetical protein